MKSIENLSLAIGLLGIAVIISSLMIMVHTHALNSLAQAVNNLEICHADGLMDCHIERDGPDYNVYGKEL